MPLIHAERDPYLSCPPVIQVPDGMTADEARQILADHIPWVTLPDGPLQTHEGARLRLVRNDFVHEGKVGDIGAELTYFSGGNVYYDTDDGAWFIHPDDVPSEDSDLHRAIDNALPEGEWTPATVLANLRANGFDVVKADAR